MSALGIAVVALIAVAVLATYVLLDRFRERRNIDTLRDRFGLDHEQAERLYSLARRDGFGSAYREVLGDADRTAPRTVRPAGPIAHRHSSEAPRTRG